jgi:hypothetical protein
MSAVDVAIVIMLLMIPATAALILRVILRGRETQ